MLCEMGVHVNILKATTAIKSHVIGHAPIKSEVSMNWREKKFKFHWEVPQEVSTLIHEACLLIIDLPIFLPIEMYVSYSSIT